MSLPLECWLKCLVCCRASVLAPRSFANFYPWAMAKVKPRGSVGLIFRPRGSIAARFVAPKRRPRSSKEKEELADANIKKEIEPVAAATAAADSKKEELADANIKKEIEPVLLALRDKRKPALRKDTRPKPFFRPRVSKEEKLRAQRLHFQWEACKERRFREQLRKQQQEASSSSSSSSSSTAFIMPGA